MLNMCGFRPRCGRLGFRVSGFGASGLGLGLGFTVILPSFLGEFLKTEGLWINGHRKEVLGLILGFAGSF